MVLEKIYRGMENGAETIQGNFEEVVTKNDDQEISGVKNFLKSPLVTGMKLVDEGNFQISVIDGKEGQLSGTALNGKLVGFGNTVGNLLGDTGQIPVTVNKTTHEAIVNTDGYYAILIQSWCQPVGTVDGFWYYNFVKNGVRAGGEDRIAGWGSNAWKNRNDGFGIYCSRLKKGDRLGAIIETSITGQILSCGIKTAAFIRLQD
ncbi:hypothetical protein [Enterococcus ureasiticus]|uniref:Uncharacterized protein n=1 Tax=Enterococcus ureasiticus TaxID=903984 RepID=A0A1E5GN37_9ENTE|nr:hypothetical protein [Enterococcus ureasiticus]OEG14071.1 hypothetical protein BCR21_03515 [Enterococcus ureasiticus]